MANIKNKILVLAIFFVSLLHSGVALAIHDRITEKAYFEDKTGAQSLDQVIDASFTPLDGLLNKGYSKSVYWMRLNYEPGAPDQRLILRILPPFIDEITIYQNLDHRWQSQKVGDLQAFNQRSRAESSLAVDLAAPMQGVIYLRIKTSTSKILDVQVLNEKDFTLLESRRDLMLGIYFGILVLLIAWTIFSSYVTRDRLITYFMLFQISEFVHGFSLMGFLSKYVLPDSPVLADSVTSLFVLLHVFMGVIFHRSMLAELSNTKPLVRTFDFFIVCNLGLLVCFFFVSRGLAVAGSGILVLPLAISMLYIPYIFRKSKLKFETGIFWTYLILSLTLIASISPYLGLIKANAVSLYATLINGMVILIALTFLLSRRRAEQELEYQQSKLMVELSQTELALEKSRREQQSQFIAMLNHELKTPLSVLKIGYTSDETFKKFKGHIQGAVADIAEIIERTLTTDKFDSQTITFKIERFSINQIIDENVEKIGKADRFVFDANELINMESDRQFVKIILSNLIDNAVKYSVESSPIRIAITRIVNDNKGFLKLTIANEIGPNEFPDANRLFEKYYRAESAGKKTGSGLGLYLVKNLTQLLGGEVYYLPQQNGVIFTLMLPIESAVRA